MLTFNKSYGAVFSISLVVRDVEGNPTGKRVEFEHDDPYKIWEFWQRNTSKPKKKRRRRTKTPRGKEAVKLLEKVQAYAEQKQKLRDGEEST